MPVVSKAGSGQPVLFLHGTPGDRSAWARVAALCPPGFEAWLMELPDHGEAPDSDEGLAVYERDVVEAIQSAGRPVRLAGLSLGAYAAARALAHAGALVSHFVACGAPATLDEAGRAWRRSLSDDLDAGRVTPAALHAQFGDTLLPPEDRDAESSRALGRIVDEDPARLARAILRTAHLGTPELALAPWTVPTVVVHARGDGLVSLEAAQGFAAFAQAGRLEVLETASHLLPLSHPAVLARYVFEAPGTSSAPD